MRKVYIVVCYQDFQSEIHKVFEDKNSAEAYIEYVETWLDSEPIDDHENLDFDKDYVEWLNSGSDEMQKCIGCENLFEVDEFDLETRE